MSIQSKKQKKSKKWLIGGIALLLLSAIVFGIVWSSVDHSFRYDKKDLSPYFDASVLDLEALKALDLEIKTNVNTSSVAAKIEEKIKALDVSVLNSIKVDKIQNAKQNDEKVFNDLVWMYYEVGALENENDTTPEVISPLTNLKLAAKDGATVVRLGTGSYSSVFEKIIMNNANFSTDFTRITDEDDPYTEGYNLVLTGKATYNNGTSDVEYAKFTDLYYYYAPAATPAPAEEGDSEGTAPDDEGFVSEYKSASTLGKTAAADDAFRAALDASGKKVGETVTFTIAETIDSVERQIKFELKVTSAVKAEVKEMIVKLDEKVSYKDAEGASKELAKDSYVSFRVILERIVPLNEPTVKKLAEKDEYTLDASLAEGDADKADERYVTAYKKHVEEDLIAEYVTSIKKTGENGAPASIDAIVRQALWDEIAKSYAKTDAMKDYPARELKNYCKVELNNYEYDYETSATNKKTYATLEDYILRSVFGKSATDIQGWDADKKESEVYALIEAEGKELIARKLVLFSLAEKLDVEATRKERKAAKQEIYDEEYSLYYDMYYNAFKGSSSSDSEAKSTAHYYASMYADSALGSLTASYLREYVTLNEVLAALVAEPAAFADAHVTWITSDAATED